jgi:predicted RNA-binding protein associated with RNAse of E/G family
LSTPITEIKTNLNDEQTRFKCERIHYAEGETVVLYRMPAEHQLEDLLLPENTLSLGYFWETRAYNAYHWVDDNRQTLALYFNVCDNTRISPTQVAWRDLTVDVLITPDLRCRVLDEDELTDDLDIDLLSRINATRDALCTEPARRLREFEKRSRALLTEV